MVDIQTIGVLATAASVTVAAIYYIFTLRTNQRNLKTNLETRQAQLFMQLYDKVSEPEFLINWQAALKAEWSSFDEYMQKYGYDAYPDSYGKLMSVGVTFEGIGVLVKRGLIDPAMVDDMMSGFIISYWEKQRPLSLEVRRRRNYPQYAEWIEYLYNVIKPIALNQHPEMKDGGKLLKS